MKKIIIYMLSVTFFVTASVAQPWLKNLPQQKV